MINYNDNDLCKNLLNEMYGIEHECIKKDWQPCSEYVTRRYSSYMHFILDYDRKSEYLRIDGYYSSIIPFTKCPFTNYLLASCFSICEIAGTYKFICGRLLLINHRLKRIYEIRNINDRETHTIVLNEEQVARMVPNPYNTIHYEAPYELNKCRKINSIYDKSVNEYNKKWMHIKNRPELKWMSELFSFNQDDKYYFGDGKTCYVYNLMMNDLYIIDILPKDNKRRFEPLTPHKWFSSSFEYKRIVLNYFQNKVNKAGELSETGRFFGSALGSTLEKYFSLDTYGLKKKDLCFMDGKCFIVNESKKIMYCIRDIEKVHENAIMSKISKSIFNDGYFFNNYDLNYNSKTYCLSLAKGNDLPNNEQHLTSWNCFILDIEDNEFDNDGYTYYLDTGLLVAYRIKKCN